MNQFKNGQIQALINENKIDMNFIKKTSKKNFFIIYLSGSPAQTISNFLEHKYEDKFIFVLLKRNTPLAYFALYKRLSNFYSCSERS